MAQKKVVMLCTSLTCFIVLKLLNQDSFLYSFWHVDLTTTPFTSTDH